MTLIKAQLQAFTVTSLPERDYKPEFRFMAVKDFNGNVVDAIVTYFKAMEFSYIEPFLFPMLRFLYCVPDCSKQTLSRCTSYCTEDAVCNY